MLDAKTLNKFRPNVGLCIFNRQGHVWLGERASTAGDRRKAQQPYRWQMPQGGIDDGETPEKAAFRELGEETGIRSARLLLITPGWLAYELPENFRRMKEWRGQRQKWAAMLFEGEDSEVNLSTHHEDEFIRWRWGALEETPDLIVPFKKDVYRELVRAMLPLRDWLVDIYAKEKTSA